MAHKKCVKKTKVCPKCSLTKNLHDFGRDSSRIDGRYTYCKECRKRETGPLVEFNKLAKQGKRKCCTCLIVKPFSAFHSDLQKSTGVTSRCKKCVKQIRKEQNFAWHEILLEKERLFSKGLRVCLACSKILSLDSFGKSNRNKYGLKPRCLKCMRDYYSNRLPSKRDYTKADIYERDEYLCYLCENPIDMTLMYPNPKSPSIDHVVPLCREGTDTASNVKATHLQCNLDKKDLNLEDFLIKNNLSV